MAMLLDAYAHQQMPFEQLVELLQPERSLSYGPMFQVMLVMREDERNLPELTGLAVDFNESSRLPAKFDLTLSISVDPTSIRLEWVYNSDLFLPPTISGFAQSFAMLLDDLTASPESSVWAARVPQPCLVARDAAVEQPSEVIVDSRGQRVAPGVVGRLNFHREGASVDPVDLIETPWLARMDHDGAVIRLGRAQDQYEVLGTRVDLEHMRALVTSIAGVDEACVVGRNDRTGRRHLCVYFRSEAALPEKDVRVRVADQVPEFMAPSIVVRVARFACDAHGLIDQEALPSIDLQANVETSRSLRQLEVDERLHKIWLDVLRLETGTDLSRSFFAIGGNSILAIRLVTAVRETFQISFPMERAFTTPTLAGQAEYIYSELVRMEMSAKRHAAGSIRERGRL